MLLKGIPKLIKVTSKKEVAEYANTKHSVKYVGSEHIECDASNVRVHAVFTDDQADKVKQSINVANHTVLDGLMPALRKLLPKPEAKMAFREAKNFVRGR